MDTLNKEKYSKAEMSDVYSSKNYYSILGVSPNSDMKDIRKRFRELAKRFHPDKNKGFNDDYFIEINRAYSVLSDKEKRGDYDNYRIRNGGASMDKYCQQMNARVQKRKRRGTEFRKKEGCSSSPPPFSTENSNNGNCKYNEHQEKKKPKKKFDEKTFTNLFNLTTLDNIIYDGSPERSCTKVMIGIQKNMTGGIVEVPFKSAHHTGILNQLDPSKVVHEEKNTNLDTEEGSIHMRKEELIFYEDVHKIKVSPLDNYPKVVVIPEGGCSLSIDQKKYKRRADLKITIDFSPTLIEDGDNTSGLWYYHDNGHPKLQKISDDPKKAISFVETDKVESMRKDLGCIDCIESFYYSCKVGHLDFLCIQVIVQSHHISEKGFCASLQLLDGRCILVRYTKKELFRMIREPTKLFYYGPAVPHSIVKNGGYSYRHTEENMDLLKIGRAPLVLIFQPVLTIPSKTT